MSKREPPSDVASLATVLPGQDVEIVRVLLRDSGSGDPHHRLRPGRRWRCRYSGSVSMLLVGAAGETISVSRDVARFVLVSAVPSEIEERPSGHSARNTRGWSP